MRRALAVFFSCVLFPLTAWSDLSIGDFTLGAPNQAVIETLQQQFSKVDFINGSHYQIPAQFYKATEPTHRYSLGDVPISSVQATFNESGGLKQLQVTLETTDAERVKQLIPLMSQAQLVPESTGRYEAFVEDGELIYWVSNIWGWTVVTIADKDTSPGNIQARAHSDKRFNRLGDKMNNLIEKLEKHGDGR